MYIGYCRVSTQVQNVDRQIDALKAAGCEKIFIDKVSGAKSDRPELAKLFDVIRAGDIIIVTELSRWGRNTRDLLALMTQIQAAGVMFRSIAEPFIDTTSPAGELIYTIFAAVAQFERKIIVSRVSDGLAAARARGRNGGRPRKDTKSIGLAMKMYESKEYSLAEITQATGVSAATLYRYKDQASQSSLKSKD